MRPPFPRKVCRQAGRSLEAAPSASVLESKGRCVCLCGAARHKKGRNSKFLAALKAAFAPHHTTYLPPPFSKSHENPHFAPSQPQPPGDADVVEVSDSEDGAPQLAAPLSPARAAALEQRKALRDALERAQRAAAASLSDDDDEEELEGGGGAGDVGEAGAAGALPGPPSPAPPPTKITVVLRTEAGQELRAAIGVREPFGKLAAKGADVAAERGWRPAGGPPPRLVLDGEALADTETPEGMDVDDGTIVDVYM